MVSREDVKKLAQLTRLQLTEQEESAAVESLNAVLALIDQLQQADVEGIEEMSYVQVRGQTLRTRPPQPQAGFAPEKLLQNAPESADGYFLAPKAVE